MRAWWPIGAVLSCAPVQRPPTPECITPCGIRAPGNCETLQALERRAVRVFGDLGWGGPKGVCAALNGWELARHYRRPSDGVACGPRAWAVAGFCVRGYTHVNTRTIELPDLEWRDGALTHELVHVLDLAVFDRAGHCAWEARGIKAALLEIQGYPDESDSESTCP